MRLLALGTLTWLTLTAFLPATCNAKSPNIVVVLTDDQGWGDLSLHGNTNLQTPNIDSLARAGAQFERFYVCPVCSPTRAEFLTGRYHPRGGVYSTSAGGERMDLDETTIADLFQSAGYRTAAFGKWHNGMQYPYHPNGRGFQEFYGFCSGHWGNYFAPMLDHNGAIVQGTGFLPDDLTERAMEFIEHHRDEPFFVYLPYNTPHSPMQVPDEYWNRFRDKAISLHHRDGKQKEDDLHLRAALAMCENIDWNVGRLLKKLDSLSLADDTVFVFFHDNGPNGTRWNGGMKGRKGSTDEGGVRSPLFLRYPRRIAAGTQVKQIAGAIDLLPTLLDLAKIQQVPKKPLDGLNLVPLLTHSTLDWPERYLFSHWRNRTSVRSQRHRLDHRGSLFDLVEDPGQRTPIQNTAVSQAMQRAVEAWKRDVLPASQEDDRPFPVGASGSKFTQLPARDGNGTGEIRRSNRYPNCSYFTNWKSSKDYIYWDIEVAEAGQFQVDAYYACPTAAVGTTLHLHFLDEHTQVVLSTPHDPPFRGAEHDRSPRMESYVKSFRPISLGRIQLQPGRGRLELRASDVQGSEVMELRLLQFERINP